MKHEEYIKELKKNDCTKVVKLLTTLPEGIEEKRRNYSIRYYLSIWRYSGEWNIFYEEAVEHDFRINPERILDESSTDLIELLTRVHQIIAEKQYKAF